MSGLDRQVRVWTLPGGAPTSVGDPSLALDVPSPCSRALFSPTGGGILTVPLRKDSVTLWSAPDAATSAAVVAEWHVGVADVAWMPSAPHDLLTLSKDGTLALISLTAEQVRRCGAADAGEVGHVVETGLLAEAPAMSPTSPRPREASPSATPSATRAPSDSPAEQETFDNMTSSGMSVTSTGTPTAVAGSTVASGSSTFTSTSSISSASSGISSGISSTSTVLPARVHNLNHEFSLVNVSIPNISVETIDATQRTCVVTGTSSSLSAPPPPDTDQQQQQQQQQQQCRVRISFPSAYPYNVPPSIECLPPVSLSPAVRQRVLESLLDVAGAQVRNNRGCLEACLRALVPSLDAALAYERDVATQRRKEAADGEGQAGVGGGVGGAGDIERAVSSDAVAAALGGASDADDYDSDTEAPLNKDDNIPFPRTSGAVFSGNGKLVCFASTFSAKNMFNTSGVPRSFEEMRRFLSLRRDVMPDSQFLAAAERLNVR